MSKCPKCGARETSADGDYKWYECGGASFLPQTDACKLRERESRLARWFLDLENKTLLRRVHELSRRVEELEAENKSLREVLSLAGIDSGDVQNYLNDLAIENMGVQKFDGGFAPEGK